ncbi:hypothetical protein HV346_10325 [Enterobacter sp. RHBSTW-00994]|uniref:hypothetical protein n=1 Tax=Enterobacteriaceae TaxID=543 RepID=UPI0015E9C447|nr:MULTISPECIES: hypothetical protein [Enterobacteriaceae]MBM3072396.1 hypothetical protein [Lelliottia sp. RWM.1]QLR43045.1 hypothetical protein HV346_10325 [Enterobacter sp. RHBSTW-00994]
MTNLARTAPNNTTGVFTLQNYKDKGYRIHCNLDQVKALTGVEAKPEHRHFFTHSRGYVYLSKPYPTVEAGKDAAIRFFTLITGVQVYWDPDKK